MPTPRPSRLGSRHLAHVTGALALLGLLFTVVTPVQARTGPIARKASPKPGAWTVLGPSQALQTGTLLHLSNGNDLVVWYAPVVNSKGHYEYVELKPNGGMATTPKDVFGGADWNGLGGSPVLVSDQGTPVLVFEGGKGSTGPYSYGCIVGDQFGPSGWTLQTWSLSAGCVNPDHFGATATSSGTLSAAWPGGWATGVGVLYRVGVANTIPASTPDQHISTAVGDAGMMTEVTDSKTQHIWAGWSRFFSKPAGKDGFWAADLSAGTPTPMKAPDAGTNTVANVPEPVAMAGPSGRGGVYMAYCNNSSPCSKVELWKVGSAKAGAVPGSKAPRSVALGAGPDGRLWIAWWSSQDGTVRVVRTNEAGNKFGPVESYPGPAGCQSDGSGTISISHGSQQRLDVVMSCYDGLGHPAAVQASAMQSIVPLQISGTREYIKHKKGGKVVYRVSDVGDAVAGATVTVDGKKGTTDKKGQITFHFPKHSKTGTYKVKATMTDYLPATAKLIIT